MMIALVVKRCWWQSRCGFVYLKDSLHSFEHALFATKMKRKARPLSSRKSQSRATGNRQIVLLSPATLGGVKSLLPIDWLAICSNRYQPRLIFPSRIIEIH
jgi:hypothetical protein